jgi:hypothetical protein
MIVCTIIGLFAIAIAFIVYCEYAVKDWFNDDDNLGS